MPPTAARPGGEALDALIDRAHTELGATLMADVDSVHRLKRRPWLGAWVEPRCMAYTQETAACWPTAWDLLAPLLCRLARKGGLIL